MRNCDVFSTVVPRGAEPLLMLVRMRRHFILHAHNLQKKQRAAT